MVHDNTDLFALEPIDVIIPILGLLSWFLVVIAIWLVLKTGASTENKIICCIFILVIPVIPAVVFIYFYWRKYRDDQN